MENLVKNCFYCSIIRIYYIERDHEWQELFLTQLVGKITLHFYFIFILPATREYLLFDSRDLAKKNISVL